MKKRNILIIGDSYSTYAGHIPEGFLPYYSTARKEEPYLADVSLTWWYPLMEEIGARLVQNNSWSGSTIGYTGYNGSDNSHSASFIYRFKKLIDEGFFENNKIDTLLVFGGTNDSWCNAPLGEAKYEGASEEELYSVLPAIYHFAALVKKALPDADILFIINNELKSEVEEALADAAARLGMPHIKLSGIEKLEGHPTALGMASIKEQVKAALLRL